MELDPLITGIITGILVMMLIVGAAIVAIVNRSRKKAEGNQDEGDQSTYKTTDYEKYRIGRKPR